MTKQELDDAAECFDPEIRLVVELPNGQRIPIKRVRYDFGEKDEAELVLETGKPFKSR